MLKSHTHTSDKREKKGEGKKDNKKMLGMKKLENLFFSCD